MKVFHILSAAELDRAREAGELVGSSGTGFVTAHEQDKVYAAARQDFVDVADLLVLTIDTDKLQVPWRGVAGALQIEGAVPMSAVVAVQSLSLSGPGSRESFTAVFFREMILRVALALLAMALAVAGSVLAQPLDQDWGPFIGALAGLAAGVLVFARVLRRRN